ncbi:MAG: RnfABCDGE type electron transport complex subunit D [Ruminococcus sp.]|nr:RnfABCDGE type electron transport complex subunit D [Ruminococcus sp.]
MENTKTNNHAWLDLIITLFGLSVVSYFYYGKRFLALSGVCLGVSCAAELISLKLMHRKFTAYDFYFAVDALIISLMLPAVFSMKIAAAACIFAVVAAKNIFGGRDNMIFSPSAAAYVFLLTSWKDSLLKFPAPNTKYEIGEKVSELVNSESHNFNMEGRTDISDFDLMLGNFSGASGTVVIFLLIVSAAVLILRQDISAGAFFGTVIGTVLMAFIIPAADNAAVSAKYSICMNMTLFSAIYIVSDKRTAPERNFYAFFYGFFTAVISYILIITTALENAIVIVAVLAAPAALGIRNLEDKIRLAGENDIENIPASDGEGAESLE